MEADDYYELLGIDRSAGRLTITRAYRRLARRLHPEMNPGDAAAEKQFRAAAIAFAVLSDPGRRRLYDAGGSPQIDVGEIELQFRHPFRDTPAVEELSAELHGGAGHADPDESPEPRHARTEVAVSFAESIRGVTVPISVQRETACPGCGGRGEDDAGTGCERCSGRGRLVELATLRVRVPPGVESGSRLRVRGRGHDGQAGPGDLHIVVAVEPHPYFQRRGLDVHATVPVNFTEATLGAEIEVPTIDGRVLATLPPGSTSGQRFRLRGRGVALPDDGRRGDHYYTVEIAVPGQLDGATRRALEGLELPNPRAGLPRSLDE